MPDFNFSQQKILLCDTDPEVIDIARTTYLDADVMDFVATPSPNEALKHIPEMKPDLILMALKFPDENGINVIQKIRSLNEGEFYKTPILMLLEKVSQNLLREACRAGIEGALRKPIVPEKVLRFSRAVITKPRRFICVRHYFGPERRYHSDPHFQGEDRRNTSGNSDFSASQLTQSRQSQTRMGTGKSALGSEPVLSGGPSKQETASSESNIDWGTSQTKPKADGGVMDYSSAEFKSVPNADNGDYKLTESTPQKSKDAEYDFTSEDRQVPKAEDFDYGSTSDRKDNKVKDIQAGTEKSATEKTPDNNTAPQKAETKAETVEVEPTGPDSDDFEKIIDLDECLELHKEWINSGGKSGQQANRPHSDFRAQELEDADFTGAILPQSNFESVKCTNTVFRKADLRGATFKSALLSSADLRVSRLTKADLRNARMDRANLLGADLSGANLEGATVRGVNLSGANLHLTNLRGVNLSTAQGLIPEQVKRAITDQATRLPLSARTPS